MQNTRDILIHCHIQTNPFSIVIGYYNHDSGHSTMAANIVRAFWVHWHIHTNWLSGSYTAKSQSRIKVNLQSTGQLIDWSQQSLSADQWCMITEQYYYSMKSARRRLTIIIIYIRLLRIQWCQCISTHVVLMWAGFQVLTSCQLIT